MTPGELIHSHRPKTFAYRWYSSLLLSLGLTLVSVELVLPIFSKLLFDFVYREKQDLALNSVIFAMVTFLIFQFVIRTAFDLILVYANERIGLEIRLKLFSYFQSLSLRYFQAQSAGDLVIRLTDDIEKATDVLLAQKMDVVFALAQIAGISSLCIWINREASLVLISSIPFYLISSRYLFKKEMGVIRDSLTAQKSALLESVHDSLRRMGMTRVFQAEKQEVKAFEGIVRTQYALGIQERVLRSVFSLNSILGFDLWNGFVVWYLGRGVIAGLLTVGDLVALLLLFGQIRQPLFSLTQQFGRFRTGIASLRRVDEVFQWPSESEEHPSASTKQTGQVPEGRIEVRNLYFRYSEKHQLFDGLNLEFAPHSYVTLAGDNGAGKSTLIRLLLGAETPNSGQILIDGKGLNEYPRSVLRNSIVCVDRDQGILTGTIRDNIAYGRKDATDSEVIQAIKDAALGEWYEKCSAGLDTVIRHEGEVSRGERQRIAIARALLVDPKVLILDEVTSDFDLITDFQIQKAIRKMLDRRTVIAVAQHASAVKSADRIIFFEGGQIKDDGTFTSLTSNRGEFFRYYSIVHGGFPEFKKMLDYEIDRCFRHNSGFSVAAFTLDRYSEKLKSLPMRVLTRLHSEILLAWTQTIRRSDAVTEYQDGVYLVLMPEFKEQNTAQYLSRMEKLMSEKVIASLGEEWTFQFRGSVTTFDNLKRRPGSSVDVIDRVIRDCAEKARKNLAA